MPTYHVFVDGAADPSTAGKERLANAIAEHYGLPVADLRARIASGRFRVKGNCDGATADMYVRDLTNLGAKCSVEEATPQNAAKTPLPFPAVAPATARTATTMSPTGMPAKPTPPAGSPAAKPRPSSPLSGLAGTTTPPANKPAAGLGAASPAAAPANKPASPLQSGLAAAFSGETPAASLGALENENLALSLASVDGADEVAPAPAAFAPPGGALSASIGEPPAKKPDAKGKPKDEPIDMFAPPEDAGGADFKVDLAPDELRSAKKHATAPPANEPAPAAPAPTSRGSRPSMQPPSVSAAPVTTMSSSPLANPRTRFVLGVAIAIVIGFVPAHLVASSREKSSFATIDKRVIETQKQADTPDAYAMLDQFRTEQLGRKRDDRRSIAMMAMLIWAAAGGALAYVWFRRIPWDRFE